MTELVSVTISNYVADVRLNRPAKMNALNPEMFAAITAAADALRDDKSVRAVVLSGEGKAFCAGLDMAALGGSSTLPEPFASGSEAFPNIYQAPAYVWKQLPVPVICALQGVAFGGGLQIALGADIRIAHPDAQLSLMEIKWGIIPDMSASQTLRDLVAIDVAKELTFSGRIVSAVEADRLGLVTRLSEAPREDAHALAVEIAAQNPDAICAAKHLFNETWHGDEVEGLQMEEQLQSRILLSDNQLEAVNAAMERRLPTFKDRC